jgi:trk system potassium uptake protein TrkH
MPFSNSDGRWLDPLSALFTSTSAVCVTGLSVVDVSKTLSPFGQGLLLLLIQLGGLQIMTMGTLFLYLLGWRISLKTEYVLMDALGHESLRGLQSLVRRTIVFSLIIEAVGSTILAWRFWSAHGYAPVKAWCHGIFHAISAFCNAGFALYPDNLMGFQRDPVVLFTLAFLIVLGGIGFIVMFNLTSIRFWSRDHLQRGRLNLHSTVVLQTTLILILMGWVAFIVLEWWNTLANLPWQDKVTCALFQSVTPRTAGFNVVDMAQCQPSTLYMTMGLMFIGGSPASTAGGIKTTTVVILALTAVTLIRGREETELKKRSVPTRIVRESLAIFMLSVTVLAIAFAVLLLTEDLRHAVGTVSASEALLFEAVSALGTVGLSTGITPGLTALGKLCLVVCMFIGRVGPLALAVIVGSREVGQNVRYPEEAVVVG